MVLFQSSIISSALVMSAGPGTLMVVPPKLAASSMAYSQGCCVELDARWNFLLVEHRLLLLRSVKLLLDIRELMTRLLVLRGDRANLFRLVRRRLLLGFRGVFRRFEPIIIVPPPRPAP